MCRIPVVDLDIYDSDHHVDVSFKGKPIMRMSALEAWQLGFQLLRCARFVNQDLPKDIEL